jgi:8-oxo-dGTP pyrophosphatase MutT (NUDIX family)
MTRIDTPPVLDTRGLLPLWCDTTVAGWLLPGHAPALQRHADIIVAARGGLALHPALVSVAQRSVAMTRLCRALYAQGCWYGWRGELIEVREGTQVLWRMERSAARYLGVWTEAVHLNAVVVEDGLTRMWVARRSATKAIDPGLADNLVAGGVTAGETPARTLVRECWEEAGIAATLAAQARGVGTLSVGRRVPEGIQREHLHVFDLTLSANFQPVNQDGEAQDLALLPLDTVRQRVCDGAFTQDAGLVISHFLDRVA